MNVESIFYRNRWLALIPIFGILFYTVFYFFASGSYGGGMEAYSIDNHLLCDLMNKYSLDGYPNQARSMAIIGNSFLFIGMTTFFYLLPLQFKNRNKNLWWAQALGVLAMFNFLFLFTDYHDQLVAISGILGTVMATLLIIEYHRQITYPLSVYAMFCLMLSLMVFISYQFKICIDLLPSFQKTVFILDGIWVLISCLSIRKHSNTLSDKVVTQE